MTTTSNYSIVLATGIATDVITSLYVVIACCVYIPVIIYCTYPLYKRRTELILAKRHFKLTLYSIYCIIVVVGVGSLELLLIFQINFNKPQSFGVILAYIIGVVPQLCSICIYALPFIRLWLTFFDIKYNLLIGSNEWKNIIDSSHNISQSFFIKYRNTFGNKKYLMKRVAIICCIVAIITFILAIVSAISSVPIVVGFLFMVIIVALIGSILSTCSMYFQLKTVEYFDDFYILKEFSTLFKVFMCFIVVNIICLAYPFSLVILQENNINYGSSLFLVYIFVIYQFAMLFAISITYINTKWVENKLKNDPALLNQYGNGDNDDIDQNLLFHNNSSQIEMDDKQKSLKLKQEIHLKDILQKSEYFESFMAHLSHEFSMECLLSLIEFVQFKQYIQQKIQVNDITDDVDADDEKNTNNVAQIDLSLIKLPVCVPQSSIVYDENNKHDIRWKVNKLYEKYIMVGAIYEINIRSLMRGKLQKKFESSEDNNLEWNEEVLVGIFDNCCESMLRLLGYSLGRFKNKQEFQKLRNFKSKD